MEKYVGITITQREKENVARLAYALAQQVDDYPAQLSHYLAYVSDQLVVDVQCLVDVVGRITSAMEQDELSTAFSEDENTFDAFFSLLEKLSGGREICVHYSPVTLVPEFVTIGSGDNSRRYTLLDLFKIADQDVKDGDDDE